MIKTLSWLAFYNAKLDSEHVLSYEYYVLTAFYDVHPHFPSMGYDDLGGENKGWVRLG